MQGERHRPPCTPALVLVLQEANAPAFLGQRIRAQQGDLWRLDRSQNAVRPPATRAWATPPAPAPASIEERAQAPPRPLGSLGHESGGAMECTRFLTVPGPPVCGRGRDGR